MAPINPARTAAEAQALTNRSNPVGIRLTIAEIHWLFDSELRLSAGMMGDDELKALTALTELDCIGFGRHRVAFALPTGEVLKIARNYYGWDANEAEVEMSGRDRHPLAWVEVWHVRQAKFSAIRVEYVTPISKDHPAFPAWAATGDDDQVGLTADGRVVFFDA